MQKVALYILGTLFLMVGIIFHLVASPDYDSVLSISITACLISVWIFVRMLRGALGFKKWSILICILVNLGLIILSLLRLVV